MVRKGGFEPPRSCKRQPLKLVRLPIPPLPHRAHTNRGGRIKNGWSLGRRLCRRSGFGRFFDRRLFGLGGSSLQDRAGVRPSLKIGAKSKRRLIASFPRSSNIGFHPNSIARNAANMPAGPIPTITIRLAVPGTLG